jgi:nucleobase:cation symporter-1, NCS1 family
LLSKGNVFIPSLYNGTSTNKNYYYNKGVNLQAVLAYIIGIALPFPGFCGELGASVSSAAIHLVDLGWILSFATSFVSYYVICSIWPTKNIRYVKEQGYGFEQMAAEAQVIDAADYDAYNDNVVQDNVYVEKNLP